MAEKTQRQFLKKNNMIKSVCSLLVFNYKTLLLFLLSFMAFSIFCLNTFVDLVGYICYEYSGISYLAPDNLLYFFSSPLVIVLVLIAFVVLAIVNIFNISALIYIFRMSYLRKKTRLRDVFANSFNTCKRVCHPKNWIIILIVLFILKYVGILSAVNPALQVVIPEFIEDFIMANAVLKPLYIVANIVFFILSLVFVFSFPIFVLSDTSFAKSVKKSKVFFKYIPITLLTYAITTVIFAVLSVSLSGAASALITSVAGYFSDGMNNLIVTHSGTVTQIIVSILAFIMFPAVSMAVLSSLFFLYREFFKTADDIKLTEDNRHRIHIPSFIVVMVLSVSVLAVNVIAKTDDMYYAFRNSQRPEIAAHRGDSVKCPENTMPAFLAALEVNSDWIELDVHQTKDDYIIVSHDDNILRVSGKDTCVHENTYADLMQLDVGSWFGEKFSYVRFSTLEEVLNTVKEKSNKAKLQIEIKPTEFDKNIEQRVTDIIEKCGMADRCVIISLKDTPLKKVKEIKSDAEVAYTMPIAFGNIDEIKWSDCFSIEATNITANTVERIHKANKKCYVWTVNTPENVQHLVDCNVDVILTDNPVMLREALDHADYKGGISKFIRMCLYQ